MEDLSIGSQITLKVVESNSSNGFFFAELDTDIFENVSKRIKCTSSARKDGRTVQFDRVK